MNEDGISVQAASILDKTDWRKTIHKCLETCVRAEGTVMYPRTVKSLVSAVSANYPGFKAKDIINKKIKQLKKDYDEKIVDYMTKYPELWYHPIKKKMAESDFIGEYYKDIYEFIKNLLARKRILLYGVRQLSGGEQMPD